MSLDYQSVLGVYPEDPSFTCVGTTRQNLRCRNSFVRNDYLREASDILDELPFTQQCNLLPKLRQLAWLTPCPRWHQSRLPQVEPVAAKWLAKIQNLAGWRPEQSLLTPPPTPPRRSAGIFQSMSYHAAPPPFSQPQMGLRDIFYQQRSSPPPPPNIYQRISYYSPPPSPTRNFSTNIFHQDSYASPPPPNINIYQSISDYSTPPPPTQTISGDAVYQQSDSPPPSQPPAPIVYQSITYNSPPPQIMSRDVVHQQPHSLAPPPPPQPRVVPTTNMSPNYNQQNLSAQPESFQQTQEYTSQTGRNVNIIFNIAVDSNGVFQDPPRRTQVQEVTTESSTQGGNASGSTIPSPPASPSSTTSSSGSTASRSSSSTSSSSSRNRRAREAVTAQLTAPQAQMTVLTEQQQAFQAQTIPARPSRTAGRATSTGSPIPGTAPTVITTPRLRTLTPSPRPSRRPGSPRNRQEPEDPNTSDDSPSSSSTNSSSNHRPGRPRARINTPSSSGNSSPVIVIPHRSRSPHPASVARSTAPSPSSAAASAVSRSVHRRPINDDTTCYVCDDPIVSEADAAWCRAACGQNICLGCFVAWVTEQRAVEQVVVCGFCRAPWRF